MKLCWTALAALGSLVFGVAEAGTLKVSPIKVFLPADGKSEVIHVRNPDATPALVQIQAVEWTDVEHLDQAKRADEIIAVPPIFEMAPESEQVIRLAHRHADSAGMEKAYRLLITEVPQEVDDGGVAFAVRLNMPLFVTPRGAEPKPEWRVQRTASGEGQLVLANRGNAHLMVTALELRAPGDAKPLFETDQFVYALAGKEQRWSLGYGQTALPESLEVLTETHLGPQQSPVMTP
ncbi:MAG: fimbria/pilus periplasmic chaperone [Alphaproteobacteria bacterium]